MKELPTRKNQQRWYTFTPPLTRAGVDRDDFLRLVYEKIIESLKLNIVTKSLHEDSSLRPNWSENSRSFLGYLLNMSDDGGVTAQFRLTKPLIAVGAPVEAYTSPVSQRSLAPTS